uniref:RING-type E3 ubiquitin transferase n=1 Tax=Callorhinchus milii TaxID=7868 RepID=A0A4W3HEX4_CALMI
MASGLQIESWTVEIICPICLDFFTDPVSLDCGHNFCRSCIPLSWKKQETNRCAVCQETFPEKKLKVNRALANLAEKARKFSLTPTQTEIKLRCEKHREELKLYCESDQKLLCLVCRDAREHRDHRFLPIEEAVEIYKETALQAEEQASSLQTQVKDDFAKIHQILIDREQRVMMDLRQREEEILQRMETNLREIQSNLDSVQQEISELQTQMEKDGPIFCRTPSVFSSSWNSLLPLTLYPSPISLLSSQPSNSILSPQIASPHCLVWCSSRLCPRSSLL